MKYSLSDILDIPKLQDLISSFDETLRMPLAIVDTEGNFLIANAWQDICTKFHRKHPETSKICLENDIRITAHLDKESPEVIYRCPVGLVDAAMPIIIEGDHFGTVLSGQLFLSPPQESYFIEQAAQYGFDASEYVAAIRKVPCFTEDQLTRNLTFVHKLAVTLAGQGLHHRRLHESEEARRASEQKYKIVADYTVDWEFWISPDGEFIYNSPSCKTVTGHEPSEHNNAFDFFNRLIHPDDKEALACHQQHFVTKKLHDEIDFRIITPDGEIRWLAHKCGPVFDATGTFLGTRGSNRDITAQKHAENKLRETAKHLEITNITMNAIIESMSDWTWEVDAQGRYTYCSSQAEKILGYAAEELIGKTPFDFMSPDEAQRVGTLFSEIANSRKKFTHLENWCSTKDGRAVLLSTSGAPIFDDAGDLAGYRGVDTDITEKYYKSEISKAQLELVNFSINHSLEDLLEETLNKVEQITGSRIGFYHFLEDDQTTLLLQNWSTRTKATYCKAEGKGLHYSVAQAGVWVDCIHQRQPVIHNDYSALTHRKGLPEGHAEVIRELVVPIFRGDQIKAILGVGNKPTNYHQQDVEVVSFLADLAWEIAERKKAEEILANREKQLRGITDSARDAIMMIDHNGKVIFWNPAAEQIFGYSADEALGSDLHEMLAPERYIESHLVAFPKFQAEGNGNVVGKTVELSAHKKDGTEISIELSLSAISHKDKWHAVGILRDITERKISEQKLHDVLQLNKSIVENAQQGIIVYDRNLCYQVWNPFMERLTGVRAADIIGKTPSEAFPFVVEAGLLAHLQRTLKGLHAESIEFNDKVEFTGRDGVVIQTSAPLLASDGEVIGVVSTVQDLTEQRKVELMLQQSQKLESIGRLAGGVAHDFNNKLTVIMGNVELARMQLEYPIEVGNCLQEIMRASEQSRDITSQLLAFSRQQVATPRVIDINIVIADSQKSLSRLITEEITIVLKPCEGIWKVKIDPTQLDQIIMNLVVNARDAMPNGGTVTIETENVSIETGSSEISLPGDYAAISISDTGSGMSEDVLQHIFEPFFTTKELGKGTGLGLATIYGIVQQNNGHISVTSKPGHGSTFRIYFPRVMSASAGSESREAAFTKGSAHILLVEDEEPVLKVTESILHALGFTVYSASTPASALEICSDTSKRIDLVITDVVMPGMTGLALTEAIRKLRSDVKVLYVSGYTTDQEVLDNIRRDNNFLQKPYDVKRLGEAVAKILED